MPVLGLPDKVGGHDGRIGRVVRDDGDLRGPGKHVDANLSVERTLGFGHELVARADDDVGRLPRKEAVSQARNGLHTT